MLRGVRLSLSVGVGVWLLSCCGGHAVSERAVVDLSSSGNRTGFDPSLVTRCVGSSHAATALRADWRAQLSQFKRDVNPDFIRFHGLLDDDMSVVVSRAGSFDFLRSIDMRPIARTRTRQSFTIAAAYHLPPTTANGKV